MRRLPSPILVVTDRHQAARPLPEIVEEVLAAGARWVWLRDRDLEPRARRRLAEELLAAARAWGASLTVGADIGLAAAIGADGVHLPAAELVGAARDALGPRALVGVSAHSAADVAEAARAGADYATLSPIFATSSKPGYGPALGLEAIGRAAAAGLPVVALGGVSAATAPRCLAAGAAVVAIMGAIMAAERPGPAFAELATAARASARAPG